MEDRLSERGIEFFPLGLETTGATTSSCAKLLKLLSEIAHTRRGHNVKAFKRKWTLDWGMVLAKRGAQVALARTMAVVGARKGFTVGAIGPIRSEDAEPALEISYAFSGGG